MKNPLACTPESLSRPLLAALFLLLLIVPSAVSAQKVGNRSAAHPAVQAQPPYTVSMFARSVPGKYTQPDSITSNSSAIFIGYGNGGAPNGSSSIPSTLVEYDFNGHVVKEVFVPGHNDGLKINPQTGDLWAVQNEDGNATLAGCGKTSDLHELCPALVTE